MVTSSRRAFLFGGLGTSVLAVGFGNTLARRGFALSSARFDALDFGALEPLASLVQHTPPAKLQPILIEKLRAGTTLDTLVAAASLANARSFGGHDYEGYHCMMALGPALEMARELPEKERPLPVLKVVWRTSARIQKTGDRDDVLQALPAPRSMSRRDASAEFRSAILARDVEAAESAFATLLAIDRLTAYEELQTFIQENLDVHKVVLAWRAWETMDETGNEHALTLLRQCVRFCIDREKMRVDRGWPTPVLRSLRPELVEKHGLASGPKATRSVSSDDVRALSRVVFASSSEDAARAMAAALGDGYSLHDAGEALSLAANALLLHDPGRSKAPSDDKPVGSVHGASVGVHAADSARAWRNIATVTHPRVGAASLIAGAYHTGGQSQHVGSEPFPYREQAADLEDAGAGELVEALRAAIEERDQATACAAASVYTERGLDGRTLLDVLLGYGVAADGALHAEKYYRTVQEELAASRPEWRGEYAISLARVTASEFGWRAPGQAEAREALGLS